MIPKLENSNLKAITAPSTAQAKLLETIKNMHTLDLDGMTKLLAKVGKRHPYYLSVKLRHQDLSYQAACA